MTTTASCVVALTVRPPVAGDLRAVFDLTTASDTREFGEPDYPFEEFAANWQALDLTDDARVAVLPDGRIVGWATLTDRGLHAGLRGSVYVHPDFEGIGVGSGLVRWTEERGAEHVPLAPEGVRVVLHHGCNARNGKAHELFGALGYREVLRCWRMQIELDPARPPAAPVWPDGIAVRNVENEADERRLYAAAEEAFRDQWGYVPRTFEQWVGRKKRHGHDPGLWLMALDGDEVAGAVVGAIFPETYSRIYTVAVRRPWRRRGVALALLREAFRRFAERGESLVALGVDAASPTGATRLYEKAGMRATREVAVYEKELRPGVDPARDEDA